MHHPCAYSVCVCVCGELLTVEAGVTVCLWAEGRTGDLTLCREHKLNKVKKVKKSTVQIPRPYCKINTALSRTQSWLSELEH